MPPVSSVLRSIWPTVAGEDGARTAYALDAALQEVIFVGGPLLVALLATVDSGRPGRRCGGPGGGRDVRVLAASRRCVPPRRQRSTTAPAWVRSRRSASARSRSLSIGLGLGFGAVEIAVPAFAEAQGNRALAGIALAGFSAGSLVGGLARRAPTVERRAAADHPRHVPARGADGAARSLATSVWTMAMLHLLRRAPDRARSSLRSTARSAGLRRQARSRRRSRGSAPRSLSGSRAGAVVGGAVIDGHGWRAAVALGIAFLASGAIVTTLRRSTLAPPVTT